MSGVLGRRHATDTSKTIKYTPCSKSELTDEYELEGVVSIRDEKLPANSNACGHTGDGHNNDVQQETVSLQSAAASTVEGQSNLSSVTPTSTSIPAAETAANGPRTLTSTPSVGYQGVSDRDQLIGEKLKSISRVSLATSTTRAIDVRPPVHNRSRSASKQSIIGIVRDRVSTGGRKNTRAFSKEDVAYVNQACMTPKEVRKHRRKDIEEKFGKKSLQKAAAMDRIETSTSSSEKDGCRWTFVFDPAGRLAYWWSFVVSLAFLYNFWVMIYRFAFEEINHNNIAVWFTLDYISDLLYVLDIAFHFRTGYLEDGVLQTDGTKLRIHYMNSTMFYIDCLCLLPLDFLYLSIGFNSILRCFRLVKIYRFWAFLDRTERHTNYPNVVRTTTLLHYLFAIYHWNACLMYLVTSDMPNPLWLYPENNRSVLIMYLHALYWSTLTLTTIGDLPRPTNLGEYVFVISEFVFGLLLFATILGHVANIVTSISTARKDFQAKLDSVKTYMTLRRVPLRLQDRVIKWFDYLWLSKKSSDEEKTMSLLPDKLRAEIALHVHLDTLKRVEIFQNTEAGFLCELVLRLKPVLFSPRDFICRKGEVGKEMYVVSRGQLQVVADNGRTVLATLRAGSYFGEISILNMGNAGNRRTACVRSVGYSDLFCLSKKDLWEVLNDYPVARVRLEAIAVKRLKNYTKVPLDNDKMELMKESLNRSKSTPGLLESVGQVPLQNMKISGRHHTLPPNLDRGGVRRAGMASRSSSGSGSRRSACDVELTDGSRDRSNSGSGDHKSHYSADATADYTLDSVYTQGASGADITHSMTVSSITSYITESSAQKSPLGTEVPKNSSSSRSSPKTVHRSDSTYNAPPVGENHSNSTSRVSSPQHQYMHQYNLQQQQLHQQLNHHPHPHHHTQPHGIMAQQRGDYPPPTSISPDPRSISEYNRTLLLHQQNTPHNSKGTDVTTGGVPSGVQSSASHYATDSTHSNTVPTGSEYHAIPPNNTPILSPSPASPYHQQGVPVHPHHVIPFNSYQTSQSTPAIGSMTSFPYGLSPESARVALGSHLMASNSAGSIARDQSNELLIQEIARLRERLVVLESENATMSEKLSQQQCDVENRLAEIEMHFCGEDDDSEILDPAPVNKESII